MWRVQRMLSVNALTQRLKHELLGGLALVPVALARLPNIQQLHTGIDLWAMQVHTDNDADTKQALSVDIKWPPLTLHLIVCRLCSW